MKYSTIEVQILKSGIGTIMLNRPQVHNAFNEKMITELKAALEQLQDSQELRVLCIKGAGKSFCAGADLDWMRRTASFNEDENYKDAFQFAEMMSLLHRFSSPTLAIVHGAVYGGGVGLVAACDIVFAASTTKFSLSEVKLGLVPAVISPYVVKAVGLRVAQRYFLSGEKFDAKTALRDGLIHECVEQEQIADFESSYQSELLACAPNAQKTAKSLIHEVYSTWPELALQEKTARLIAKVRSSDEGKEGINAFLEKRSPVWRSQ